LFVLKMANKKKKIHLRASSWLTVYVSTYQYSSTRGTNHVQVLMAFLFAIFFPFGAIIVKLLKAPTAGRVHGAIQAISYVGALAGFGIGAYMATMEDSVCDNKPWVSICIHC
jgi:hypothetical protein